MTTEVSRQNRTLLDALVPYRGIWVDIATIIVGSLLIAAFAQLKYTLPTTVVPITGQTFAVLLVAATVGSKRGGLAAVLYLFEGSAGLPFWAGGSSGTIWSIVSGGYIVGFIPAAFLVGFLASRRLEDRVNLFIDVSGYQERRNQSLANMAQRVAQRVASSGQSVTLEPMPPNERRVVHMALSDFPGVETTSIGDGDGRQVVVGPTF